MGNLLGLQDARAGQKLESGHIIFHFYIRSTFQVQSHVLLKFYDLFH